MIETISHDRQLQGIVKVTALPACPPDRELAEELLRDIDPGLAFRLPVEHVMEMAHALQRAGVLKIQRAAQHEPVTVGPELAEKVRQRAERDAGGRCCPSSIGELSPTCCQYCSQSCS
jgi:hypothetical protein